MQPYEFLRKIVRELQIRFYQETTTIYVRVAKPTEGQAVTSPLDEMTQKQTARSQSDRQRVPSVGKLDIYLKPEASERPGFRKAKVTLSVQTDTGPFT